MSVNSLNELTKGLRQLPDVSPPGDMLEQVRDKIRRRSVRQQQFMQFGGVSCMALLVFGLVFWHQPYLNRHDPTTVDTMPPVETTPDDPLHALQQELLNEFSASTIERSAIIVRLADINTELDELEVGNAARRDELLKQKDTLKRSYRLLKSQSPPITLASYNGVL